MTNEKSLCTLVGELYPLYTEGLLTEEARVAVETHLADCPACAAQYAAGVLSAVKTAAPDAQKTEKSRQTVFKKLQWRARLVSCVLMMLGLFFGLSLGADIYVFYNIVLMPVVGFLGYWVFRKAAFFVMPVLVPVAHVLYELLVSWQEKTAFSFGDVLGMSFLYDCFAFFGIVAAFLYSYALEKEKTRPVWRLLERIPQKVQRITALCLAFAMTLLLCAFAFMNLGNPVSYLLARGAAQKRLETVYSGSGAVIESVKYDIKGGGGYTVKVQNPTRLDGNFLMSYDMLGRLSLDNYESAVTGGGNTERRLWAEYREKVGAILKSPLFPYETYLGYGDLKFSYEVGVTPPEEAVSGEDLEPDGIYDVGKMGETNGYLILYVNCGDATRKDGDRLAKEVLQKWDALCKQAGVGYYAVEHLVLRGSNADGTVTYLGSYENIPRHVIEDAVRIQQLSHYLSDLLKDGN